MLNKFTKYSGIILITSSLIFLITEFITAATCPEPYSYTQNFISNLGVRGPSVMFGQHIESPLSWLMNSGFIIFGVLSFLGILLTPTLNNKNRKVKITLSFLAMIGVVLVGLFHGSQEALLDGTGMYHSMGAFLSFISGNILIIILSTGILNNSLRRKLIRLGSFGLFCTLAYVIILMMSIDDNPIRIIGLIERGAVYPFLFGLIYYGNYLNNHQTKKSAN